MNNRERQSSVEQNQIKDDVVQPMDEVPTDTLFFSVEDTIVFELENNYSAGKNWNINENSDSLRLISKRMNRKQIDDKNVDFQKFKFDKMPAGVYQIFFENKRSFGTDTSDIKQHNKVIIIKEE